MSTALPTGWHRDTEGGGAYWHATDGEILRDDGVWWWYPKGRPLRGPYRTLREAFAAATGGPR